MKKALIAASTLFASVEILTLVHLPVMALPKPSVRVSQAVQAPLPLTLQFNPPRQPLGLV